MTINRTFDRPDPALVEAFKTQSPATLHEALGQNGAMPFYIKPLFPGRRVCGPALTVACRAGDNLMIHCAVALAQAGDVLVVDFKGMTEAGPWGDVLTEAALVKGIAGLVIDGCVHNARTIRDLGFPVFARGTNMKGTTKMLLGGVNVSIICASVPVAPGDLIVGDDDGVVVVPQAQAAAVLERAHQREADEEVFREQIRAGKTTIELLKLEPYLRAAGWT